MQLRMSDMTVPVSEADLAESLAYYRNTPTGRGPRDGDELAAARRNQVRAVPDGYAIVETVEVDGRSVPVRIIPPTDGRVRGIHLNIHGGGFYLGSAVQDDLDNRRLADELGSVVVGVEYRLAPEDPWPAAPDDCETAMRWLIGCAHDRFGTDRITIGGFSAGATLAVTTLLRLRDHSLAHHVAGAALHFGTWDLSATTPAGRLICDEYFLEAYVGGVSDRTIPDVSPAFADLSGLPPVLIVVGERDVLLDDNIAMAARLALADNDVDLRIYPGVPHGFTGHPTPIATAAVGDVTEWLRQRLESGRPTTPSPDTGDQSGRAWDDASLKELRRAVAASGPELVDLLKQRPVPAVLQYVGDAVTSAVENKVAGADDVAAKCANALRARGWDGDDELAAQLEGVLGGPTPMLRPIAVTLEDIADLLEGDLRNGDGYIDLQTGMPWEQSMLDDVGSDMFDEDELEDSERWFFVENTGSRSGYRDMEDFLDSVVDEALAEKLSIALAGKGAFRRFKDVLFDSGDEFIRYRMFSAERKRGRARQWLSHKGYRSEERSAT